MKASINILTIIIFNLIFLSSCSSNKEESEQPAKSPRIKKMSKLTEPALNSNWKIGDQIPFTITSDETPDSIIVEYENQKNVYESQTFQWDATSVKVGKQRLKVTVYIADLTEVHYLRLTFFSNISPQEYAYQIINDFPHDRNAYTQGLFMKGDTMIESTGRNGESRLIKYDLTTGNIYKEISLPSQYFGEGSTLWNNEIFYLTWTSQIGFVYDANFNQKRTIRYPHQGWGITTIGDTLIVSDGTEVLHMVHPQDFAEINTLQVYDHEQSYSNLNELEVINGLIYANVFLEDIIIVIDPETGKVIQKINMNGLLPQADAQNTDVLNGIAAHNDGRIFVTGKLWPSTFEVEFIPQNN